MRPRTALRRRASAWLVVASLLGLLGLQPVHGPARAAHTDAAASVGTLALSSAGSHGAAHDAAACQVCRAVSQARVALRPALPLAAAPERLQPLHVPAAPLPGAAPTLRDAWPRAPPAAPTA